MSFFQNEQNEAKLGEDLSNALGQEGESTEENQEEGGSEQQEVETIKLGEQEYSREELDQLVGLGQKAREIEKNHGDFDNYVSEFGRKSAKIGELNKQIEELSKSTNPQDLQGDLSGDSLREAQEAARKLGIPLTEDVKSIVQEILDQNFQTKYSEVRAGEKIFEETKALESEINGSDGRPKFDSAKVLEFMQQNPGFKNPKQAYEAMHPEEIAQWRVNEILKSKKGIVTQTDTNSAKAPSDVKINNANLHQMLAEQLNN